MAAGGKRINSGRKSSWGFPVGTPLNLIKLPIQLADAIKKAKTHMSGDELIKLLNLGVSTNKGLSDNLIKLPNQKSMDSLHLLLEENALLRDQALSNPPKQWVKSNFGVADGSICSKVTLSAKEALGLIKDDYSHNREINTWLSMRSPTEIAAIIQEAKGEVSSKRKKSYSEANNRPVKKRLPKNYKMGTAAEVLARFLPVGVHDNNDMRSALSDGYRKANGITGKLKANDAPRLNEYLKALSADEINQLIQIKKNEMRAKAKAKRLGRKSAAIDK